MRDCLGERRFPGSGRAVKEDVVRLESLGLAVVFACEELTDARPCRFHADKIFRLHVGRADAEPSGVLDGWHDGVAEVCDVQSRSPVGE